MMKEQTLLHLLASNEGLDILATHIHCLIHELEAEGIEEIINIRQVMLQTNLKNTKQQILLEYLNFVLQ